MKARDEMIKSLIKVLSILILVALLLNRLGLSEIEVTWWNAIISYTITVLFYNHFKVHIKKNKAKNQNKFEPKLRKIIGNI